MTVEVITFPDIVEHAQTYLTAQLSSVFADTAEVVHTIPTERPDRMVKLARVGGERLDLIRERAMLLVECWDVRADLAHDLAQIVRGLLWAMPDRYTGATIYRVTEAGGIAELPDPDTASPRFTFSLLLDVRGSAL